MRVQLRHGAPGDPAPGYKLESVLGVPLSTGGLQKAAVVSPSRLVCRRLVL